MRLFVSVEPAATAVAALVRDLATVDLGEGRPVPAERWHVTLAFLGEVAAERLPRLEHGLAGVADSLPPLELRISGGGTFPRRGPPSVLWAAVVGDVEALARLARAVGRAVRAAGIPLERRAFTPHLTVARYRGARPGAADAAVDALSRHSGPAFVVDRLCLMRSHLGPSPRHEPVRCWPLGPTRVDAGARS